MLAFSGLSALQGGGQLYIVICALPETTAVLVTGLLLAFEDGAPAQTCLCYDPKYRVEGLAQGRELDPLKALCCPPGEQAADHEEGGDPNSEPEDV